MTTQAPYSPQAPSRAEVDVLPGTTVIEFGTNWCSICQGAQSAIAKAFEPHAGIRHLKVEDGPGRPLGRSFKVKLWPTLIFMRDGAEVARIVRPINAADIAEAFASL
jgi:thioredoxin 1